MAEGADAIASGEEGEAPVKPRELPDTHRLLLRTLLLGDEAAREAFDGWQRGCDLETVEPEVQGMMTMLGARLMELGVEHPWKAKLNGIWRRTWYANELAWKELGTLTSALEDARIPVVVLGDALVAVRFYAKAGMRGVGRLELAVPSCCAAAAIGRLTTLGCVLRSGEGDAAKAVGRRWVSSEPMRTPGGRMLDLRWHVLPEWPTEEADGALGPALGDRAGAAGSLLMACAGTMRAYPGLLRGLADAAAILRSSEEIDWERLVSWAVRYRTVLPVRRVFHYLREIGVEVPGAWVAELDALPLSFAERLEERWLASVPKTGLAGMFWEYSALAVRMAGSLGLRRVPAAMAGLLRQRWRVRRSAGVGYGAGVRVHGRV